jgi:hypothetical protein
MPGSEQFDPTTLMAIRQSLQSDPMFDRFIEPKTPMNGLLHRISIGKSREVPLTEEKISRILNELQRLLSHSGLSHSEQNREILAALLIAYVLKRPQFCDTGGIKRLCKLNPDAPVAMHIIHIKDNLEEIYRGSNSDVEVRFKRGSYQPIFVFKEDESPEWDDSPSTIIRHEFSLAAYRKHVAYAHTRGVSVRIYSRTGEELVQGDAIMNAIKGTACGGQFDVLLLNPDKTSDDGDVIAANRDTLVKWLNSDGLPVIKVDFHTDESLKMNLTLIGTTEILIAYHASLGRGFFQCRKGDIAFEPHVALIPNSRKGPGRAENDLGAADSGGAIG